MFALGFLAAGLVIARRFKELGKPVDWAYEMVFAALVGGLVGSRLDFLIENWDDVSDDLLGNLFSGSGLVWYGGAIGGAIGVFALGLVARDPQPDAARLCAPALALGYAIGRIGCQLSGDGDYGKPGTGRGRWRTPTGPCRPTDRPPDADLRDARDGPRRLRALAPARPASGPGSCSPST